MTLAADDADHAGLGVFRAPRSVTVVGASADPSKWGYWLARGALSGSHRRPVHLVNRNLAEVDGHASVGTLAEVDGALDLVVLCTPATTVPDIVAEALRRGARGFIGITAGIDSALDSPGAERAMVASILEGGARIVGPNCLGLYDAEASLHLAWGDFVPGSLAIVSQSGQVGSELADLAAERGVGVSRFVSVGNQADVEAAEVLADLAHHEQTRAVALYVENFADGRALVDTLRTLRAAGKETVVLAVGASDASRGAAESHTGSLTSELAVVDAACRAAGAVRVATPVQLVEAANLLINAPRPVGNRVAIVGDSGGQGAIAADVMTARGLTVGRLADGVRRKIEAMLPDDAGLHNPIDLAGAGERGIGVYADVVDLLLADEAIDAVAVTGYFGSYGVHVPSLQDIESAAARRIADAAAGSGKPVVLHSMCPTSPTIDLLRDGGVPSYQDIDTAASSLAAAVDVSANTGREIAYVRPEPGDVPAGYLGARGVLAWADVEFPAAYEVTTAERAAAAATRLTAPYVLKADWLAHKTEAGGVDVGLRTSDEVSAAFERMAAGLGPGAYVLEEMDTRADCVEMLVGARWDPAFGPTVMIGAGGVEAELFGDTAVELAPVDTETANRMVARLRTQRLLTGWRSRPSVDIDGLVRVIVSVSQLIASRPDCAEIEVNPLRVGPDGVRAVDALVIPAD